MEKYKRFVVVGCSHGYLADPKHLETVLKFCKEFKPHRRIHLGDFTDQACFRAGAKDGPDQAVSIADDLTHGLNFLKAFQVTDVLNGNHEQRLWNLADHHNEVIRRSAGSVIKEIRVTLVKLKARHIDHYDITRSWITMGDTKLLHGFMYGENATRDHAETFGKCIHAHTHRPGMARGRRVDRPVAIAVGTLANIPEMSYALTRRSTISWGAGLAYGEYSDTDCRAELKLL
jgi:hypothetical protein